MDIFPGVELLDHMVLLVLIFRKTAITVFLSCCTNLHSQQQSIRVLSPSYLDQHLLSPVFWMILILTSLRLECGFDLHSPGDQWYWPYFNVLKPSGHWYVFFGKMSFQFPCPLLNWGVWGFLLLSYMSSLYILDINFANIFSHSIDSLFILLLVFSAMQKLFS